MGLARDYIKQGGFRNYLYLESQTITVGNQMGKVMRRYDAPDNHIGLPTYSNTSEIYFKQSDSKAGEIEQMRVYNHRRMAIDFDWGHTDKQYTRGIVHVHFWAQDSKGKWHRTKPRFMNNSEIKQYGAIIKKANPNAKLRKSRSGK